MFVNTVAYSHLSNRGEGAAAHSSLRMRKKTDPLQGSLSSVYSSPRGRPVVVLVVVIRVGWLPPSYRSCVSKEVRQRGSRESRDRGYILQCIEDMADKEETEKTIAEDLVVTKYKMAGEIVNRKETESRVRAGGRAAASVRRVRVPRRRGHMECGVPMPGPRPCAGDPTSSASPARDSATLPQSSARRARESRLRTKSSIDPLISSIGD